VTLGGGDDMALVHVAGRRHGRPSQGALLPGGPQTEAHPARAGDVGRGLAGGGVLVGALVCSTR